MLFYLSGGSYPALLPNGANNLSFLLSFINAENGADLLSWGGLANKHLKAFRVQCSSEAVSRLQEDIPLCLNLSLSADTLALLFKGSLSPPLNIHCRSPQCGV